MDFRHYNDFSRHARTHPLHTPFCASIPWLTQECSLFPRTDAIFRQNCRNSAALINGQEAQNHGAWGYAGAKASLAFCQ